MSHAPVDTSARHSIEPTRGNSLSDCYLYLSSFLRSGLNVASLMPSSRSTAQAMLRDIDFSQPQTIVELGAGTGAVTAHLLQATHGRGRTLIVERDRAFHQRLKERFPSAEIIAGDALQLPQLLHERGIESVDHVLSTIPVNWFTPEEQQRFFNSVRRYLKRAGTFRQLTHLPWLHGEIYRQHFSSVSHQFILRNLPPAGCYVCRPA